MATSTKKPLSHTLTTLSHPLNNPLTRSLRHAHGHKHWRHRVSIRRTYQYRGQNILLLLLLVIIGIRNTSDVGRKTNSIQSRIDREQTSRGRAGGIEFGWGTLVRKSAVESCIGSPGAHSSRCSGEGNELTSVYGVLVGVLVDLSYLCPT